MIDRLFYMSAGVLASSLVAVAGLQAVMQLARMARVWASSIRAAAAL